LAPPFAIFHRIFPFIDRDSGGSVAGLLNAPIRILLLADDHITIIPGRGPLTTKVDLQRDLAMLEDAHKSS